MTEPLLSIQHVAKHYGAIKALEDVSFDVHAGEVLALLGDTAAKLVAAPRPASSLVYAAAA